MRTRCALLLLGALLPVAPADGAVYVSPQEVELESLLPPPPAPGSPADVADLESVLWIQSRLTAAELAEARRQGDRPWDEFIRDLLGPGFTAASCPEAYRVLAGVRADFEAFLAEARVRHPRPRPPHRDPRVRLLGTRTEVGSYPSSKVWSFYQLGLLVVELHPAARDRLEAEIRRQGWMRVWGGHHYPSDVAAGLIAGERLARAILASPRFQAELPLLRAEAERLRLTFPSAP
jgi:hypothetical protein